MPQVQQHKGEHQFEVIGGGQAGNVAQREQSTSLPCERTTKGFQRCQQKTIL